VGPDRRKTLRNLSLKGLSLGFERACRLAVVVASARILGEAAFGRFVFASTVTTLLALGTDLGLGVWTTRALARDRGEAEQVVRAGFGLRSLAAVPYGIAVAAVALALSSEARAAMLLLGAAALFNSFVDHFGAVLRGCERFADEARLNALRALLTVGAGSAVLALAPSLTGLCTALAGASLGSFVYAMGTPLRSRAGRTMFATAFGKVDWTRAKAALKDALPIWMAGLLSIAYFKVDTVFLRWMSGDAELGAYGAAYKFFEGSMVVPAVLLAVTFPRLARAHDNAASQRRLERRLGLVLLALGVLSALACLLGATILVRLVFGPAFGRAAVSLRMLALGMPLLYLNYGLTHFLVGRDMGRATLWLALMMLVLNVTFDLALIPRMSGPGAACATILSEVGLTLACLGALRRKSALVPPQPSARGAARRDPKAA
jgi:O-antigen/teichoic acid export membrane protein